MRIPLVNVLISALSWTIWLGLLDEQKWGKGHGARHPIQDNLEKVDDWRISDKS